jgi:hypothetical protein
MPAAKTADIGSMMGRRRTWAGRRGTRGSGWLALMGVLVFLVGCRTPEPELDDLPPGATGLPIPEDEQAGLPPGWRIIPGVVRVDLPPGARECLSPCFPDTVMALGLGPDENVWAGTSSGRLYRLGRDGAPSLVARFPYMRINALSVPARDRVWVATSDGLRSVQRTDRGDWKVERHRYFYEGDPIFVSAVYIPDDHSDRLFGEVEDVVAWRDGDVETVVAVSSAYGVFSYLSCYDVWQHFSRWHGKHSFCTRELIPHRRPQCGFLDASSRLWLGTQEDGVVCLPPSGKEPDRTTTTQPESRFPSVNVYRPHEIGPEVDCVVAVAGSLRPNRIWCVARGQDWDRIARFDSGRWQVRVPDWVSDRAIKAPRHPHFDRYFSVAEIADDRVLIATSDGIHEYDWTSDKTRCIRGVDGEFRAILRHPDGRVVVGGSDLLVFTPPKAKK